MKPRILTMQAFGPYAQKTVVDFTKLERDGLFLVCGATGAGKTTVFDAIVYALFGEASGAVRTASVRIMPLRKRKPTQNSNLSIAAMSIPSADRRNISVRKRSERA